MVQRIISTVGTSLLESLKKGKEHQAELHQEYLGESWTRVGRGLRKLSSDDRFCGAEINSLHHLLARKKLD